MPGFYFSVYNCFKWAISKKVREGFILKRCKLHIRTSGWILYSLLSRKNKSKTTEERLLTNRRQDLAPGKLYSLLTAHLARSITEAQLTSYKKNKTWTHFGYYVFNAWFGFGFLFLLMQILRNVLSVRVFSSSLVFGVGFKHTLKCFL